MENLDLRDEDLRVPSLGDTKIDSPLGLSQVYGDAIADYVEDGHTVLLHHDRAQIQARLREGKNLPAFEKAGPRSKVYFDPSKCRAAIVTCGGLCPGINNVIRELVRTLLPRLRGAHGVRHPLRLRGVHRALRPRAGDARPGDRRRDPRKGRQRPGARRGGSSRPKRSSTASSA